MWALTAEPTAWCTHFPHPCRPHPWVHVGRPVRLPCTHTHSPLSHQTLYKSTSSRIRWLRSVRQSQRQTIKQGMLPPSQEQSPIHVWPRSQRALNVGPVIRHAREGRGFRVSCARIRCGRESLSVSLVASGGGRFLGSTAAAVSTPVQLELGEGGGSSFRASGPEWLGELLLGLYPGVHFSRCSGGPQATNSLSINLFLLELGRVHSICN